MLHIATTLVGLACGCSLSIGNAGATTAGAGSGGDAAGTTTGVAVPPGFDAALELSTLAFAVVGDTRPSSTCLSIADCGYPSSVIQRIYRQIDSAWPAVPIAVSTGDYQYNAPGDGTATWQVLQQYLPATRGFQGAVFPAMGNHECNGYTVSNCVPGGPLPCNSRGECGVTENLAAFNALLASLGLPGNFPYYAVRVRLPAGLSAKLVVAAPNAWSPRQAAWLANTLAQPTTYTFLVQHEPNALDLDGASAPTSLADIRAIVRGSGTPATGETYPLTLWLVGHTHNFDYDPAHQQVISGLGGAPTDALADGEDPAHFYRSDDGAYLVCREQATGSPAAIQCALHDSQTDVVLGGGTTFAVNADGTPATIE